MATTIKESALGIAGALFTLHQAVKGTSAEGAADELHKKLRRGLFTHGPAIGLSLGDITEIDTVGPRLYGGTPKGPPPDPE